MRKRKRHEVLLLSQADVQGRKSFAQRKNKGVQILSRKRHVAGKKMYEELSLQNINKRYKQ
jgi:hypothetical protein